VQQLSELWSQLEPRRRIVIAAATAGVFIAIIALARVAAAPSMALLYAGLDGPAAGEVVQVLEARNIRYEVRGDAIFVPADTRDETRMQLAAQNLPAAGGAGYELLDGLSGFGTTSQMFDAAYWRAKEGELARTITAAPHIRTARVHIAQGSQTPFRREVPPRASVTVSTATGGLSRSQARALRFLVASAVAGMDIEDVSVIDAEGGLIAGQEEDALSDAGEAGRAERMRRNVERLLEAHLGPGRAVVELSIDTDTDRETIRERRFDPDSRVAISTESEERSRSATDSRAPGVTVASNLPDGDGAQNGQSNSQELETRERTNFEVSETEREILRSPGAIRRLSVAVLVDGVHGTDAAGAPTWTPRPTEELEALRDLVASAVGFDEARGDVVTLRTLRFEQVPALGTEASPQGLGARMPDPLTLAAIAALALLALALIVFVLRPILRAARAPDMLAAQPALSGPSSAPSPLSLPATATADPSEWALPGSFDTAESLDPGGGVTTSDTAEDPVERLRALIAERQVESVEIIRHWMQDKERRN